MTWFLEYRYFQNDSGKVFNMMTERPRVFFYNALLVLILAVFVQAILRRPFVSIAAIWVLVIILSYVNANKFAARGAPVLPEDFQLADQATALVKFVNVGSLVKMILACGLAIFLGILLDAKTKKHLGFEFPKKLPRWLKRMVIPRIAIAVIAAGLLVVATDFVRNHQGLAYERVEWLDTTFTAWNQNRNYDENGVIIGFLYNLNKLSLEEPEGYSREKIVKIYDTYKDGDKETTSLEDADYNIVIVLNESFYDPALVSKYYEISGGDPTPTWHEIQKKYPSGYMYSTEYGGGTANVEFEVFTGLTNYWAKTVPFTDLFPRLKKVPSMANFAKKSGYKAIALHPYIGGMYKRDIALKIEGYDEFIDASGFQYTEHDGNSQYINDRSSYQQTLAQLKSTDQKQMIELVTMQNHLPFDRETYEHLDFSVDNVEDPEAREDIEVYLQTLSSSDRYLKEFIDELDKLDEKTVVMFFGDHSPGVFSKLNTSDSEELRNITQLTPYFIYSNFELPDTGEALVAGATEKLPSVVKRMTLPTTTPNCLSSTLFKKLDVTDPTLDNLVASVCAEVPVLSARYLNEGEPKGKAVNDYKFVNYDILGGKQYWLSL